MQTSGRFYTLAEANAKVPALESQFGEVEKHLSRARELNDQVEDLEVVWGAKVLDVGCPDREGYLAFKRELETAEEAIAGILKEVQSDGIEVKDVGAGLVDFYAKRGADVVFLCWKRGEKEVGFWHTLQGGFAGRKPLAEF